jgi:hypothetical protein
MRIRIRFRIQLINYYADPDPDFYTLWTRIRTLIEVIKMTRILIADADPDAYRGYQNDADPDPQHCP